VSGGAGGDVLAGGAGVDTASYATSTTAVTANLLHRSFNTGDAAGDVYDSIENLIGGAGDDMLTGDDNANRLDGGVGNDTLIGGVGADALVGGAGTDTASYVTASEGVSASLATPATNTGDAAGDTYTTIENLTGSAFADTLTGNAAANVLTGGLGNDTLNGGAGVDTMFGGFGDDTLNGGTGADMLVGGAGNDTYIVDAAGDVVTENAGEGIDQVQTSVNGYTLGANVENLTMTGVGNIAGNGNELANVITGNIGNNVLSGNGGDDTLIGNDGNDTLNGGIGADTMRGGAGNDTFVVDNAGDVAIEASGEGVDLVQTSLNNYGLGSEVENLTFTGTGDFTGSGNELGNTITGGAGNDNLSGGAGNDTLNGGAGDDTLTGGLGNDRLTGGTGIDTASYVDETDNMVVDLAAGTARRGSSGAPVEDTLATIENVSGGSGDDSITGNGAANLLKGGGGIDAILGGGGNDIIVGEAGDDIMSGGAGADTYVFDKGFGHDVIAFGDSGTDQDTLDFSTAIFKDSDAVMHASHQVGDDVHIDVDEFQGIILTNMILANLGSDDFRFHS